MTAAARRHEAQADATETEQARRFAEAMDAVRFAEKLEAETGLSVDGEPTSEWVGCEWFALCDHPAAGVVKHPVLGDVPTCERCASQHGLTLEQRGGEG
jgi:hypothetical protein